MGLSAKGSITYDSHNQEENLKCVMPDITLILLDHIS